MPDIDTDAVFGCCLVVTALLTLLLLVGSVILVWKLVLT